MSARDYFLSYVYDCGGRQQAAQRLGIPYPTICAICNGHRGISKRMAERMASASGHVLDPNKLIWVRATVVPGEAREQVA